MGWFRAVTVGALVLAGCAKGESRGADLSGAVSVADSTGDTIVVTVSGDPAPERIRHLVPELSIASTADDTATFAEIYEVEVDRAGRMWVFDNPSNRIFLFGPDGELTRRIGRQGAGPGEFNSNNGMVALADSGLAMWDARNARVSFFSAAGDFVRSYTTPAQFSTSDGLHRDTNGTLYLKRPVTPPREGEILGRMGLVRMDSLGAFADSLVPPDIAVPRDVYVAAREGSRSSTNSQYAPQYLWTWHPAGYFVVADGGKYEIIVARPTGKPLMIRRQASPVPLTPEQRKEDEDGVLWQMRSVDPSWTWSGPPIPQNKAPLSQVFVARDGRIWARVATPSERIPDDELLPQRPNGPPVRRFRAPASWEVFAPDGRFLGRIDFPRRTTLVQADGDRVWAIGRDENDVPAILRLRIEPSLAAPPGN